MRSSNTKKLAVAAIFVAIAVVGSAFISFPVFGSKCSPTQHMVNVLCAVFLGPWYGVGVAFCASLIRNLVGAGTLMAFPGSMIGALCCGLVFKALKNKNEVAAIVLTLAAEMLGTGVLGGPGAGRAAAPPPPREPRPWTPPPPPSPPTSYPSSSPPSRAPSLRACSSSPCGPAAR